MDFAPDLIQTLQRAERFAVLTGAGVSQESGLRTFRDAQTGLWAQYQPTDLASPEAFTATRNWSGTGMPGGARRSKQCVPTRDIMRWWRWRNRFPNLP